MIKTYSVYVMIFGLSVLGGTALLGESDLELDKAHQKLESVSDKLEKNQKKLNIKKNEKRQTEKSLGHLQRELKKTTLQVKKTQKKLNRAHTNITSVENQLQQLNHDVTVQRALLRDRMKQLYLHQDLGFVEFLFSSKDFISAIDSRYYFERIIKTDMELIEKLAVLENRLIDQKEFYAKEKNKMARLRNQMKNQEHYIVDQRKLKKKKLKKLRAEISLIEKQTKELERSSQTLAKFIVKQTSDAGKLFTLGNFIKPTHGWISSYFGWRIHPISKRRRMHNGIDIAAPTGYKIRAAESGIVIVAGSKAQYRGYGKVTVISHGKKKSTNKQISTVYAHQSRILVKEGQFVEQGDVIGLVGSTGYSTGPHLHLEVRENGRPVNPTKYVNL